MSQPTTKKMILTKTFEVGTNTFASRLLGLTREILLMRFLGIGIFADAFTTAFMLPNSLRKIFAEGALSAAFVPTFITISKNEGREEANKLTTLCFVVFETALLILCALVMWQARSVVYFCAPGYSHDQVAATIPMLRILMPFIFFVSTSALLTGALNSVQHFFVPAFGPVLLNVVFIASLIACLKFGLSAHFLCWSILAAGTLQCLMHIIAYTNLGFSFALWDAQTVQSFKHVLWKFLFGFISMSVMEVNFLIDHQFASFCGAGSTTLIKYANRFMGIPLGIFAVAFSTILLPYFTRVRLDNPERLKFYLLEAAKLVFWVTIPATVVLIFLSDQVFLTLFASMSSKFPVHRVHEAGNILIGFTVGLACFSLNKILFSLYYSLHDTFYPTVISVAATVLNLIANFFFVGLWGVPGLALATSLSGLVQMVMCLYFLGSVHKLWMQVDELVWFTLRYMLQVGFVLVPLYALYHFAYKGALKLAYATFFTTSFGFWIWAGPMILLAYGLLYLLRKPFGVSLYFLD